MIFLKICYIIYGDYIMRLDKFLANLKYGSRSEIKKMCKDGFISVNDNVIKNSDYNINALKDLVKINGKEVFYKEKITLAINKPSGYICSTIDEKYPSLLNILDDKYKRFDFSFAGRLDQDTLGLVIVSTDGELIHNIISPKKDIKKTYYVRTSKIIIDEKRLEEPLKLLDGNGEYYFTNGAKVSKISDFELYLTINEGKFHQVKRMIESIDNSVVILKRVSIGNYVLPNDLEEGKYIEIEPNEIF